MQKLRLLNVPRVCTHVSKKNVRLMKVMASQPSYGTVPREGRKRSRSVGDESPPPLHQSFLSRIAELLLHRVWLCGTHTGTDYSAAGSSSSTPFLPARALWRAWLWGEWESHRCRGATDPEATLTPQCYKELTQKQISTINLLRWIIMFLIGAMTAVVG